MNARPPVSSSVSPASSGSAASSRFASRLGARALLAIAGGLLFASAAACSSANDPTNTGDGTAAQSCKAGSSVACTCADGASGTETCGSTTCTCASAGADAGGGVVPPADAGTHEEDTGAGVGNGDGGHLHDAAPPETDGAAGTYGADCKADKDCTDPVYNACFIGGNRSFCTKHCATAADCPTPPTVGQCNKQLYCK